MSTLFEFRLSRAPQRTVPDDLKMIPLIRAVETRSPGSALQPLLLSSSRSSGANDPQMLVEFATSYLASHPAASIAGSLTVPVNAWDRWLTKAANFAEPTDFMAQLPDHPAKIVASPEFDATWNALAHGMVARLLTDREPDVRARLLRLLMVMALVDLLAKHPDQVTTAQELHDALRWRRVLLPEALVTPLQQARAIYNVRSGFSDLYVVRDEWERYVLGEISYIENILPHEKRGRHLVVTDENEITQTTDTLTEVSSQLDSQTTDRSELHDQATDQASLAAHIDGKVDTSGQYGPTKVDTHIGASLDFSTAQSETHAKDTAHEVVSHAITKVEEQVRNLRVERRLERTVTTNDHVIDNTASDQPVVGVYRWVNKLQRMVLYKYPHRYLVETQVNEPGAELRELLARGNGAAMSNPKPAPFTIDGTEKGVHITPDALKGDTADVVVVVPPPPPASSGGTGATSTGGDVHGAIPIGSGDTHAATPVNAGTAPPPPPPSNPGTSTPGTVPPPKGSGSTSGSASVPIYMQLAARYQATGVNPPPETLVVAAGLLIDSKDADFRKDYVRVAQSVSVTVPSGYVAKSWTAAVLALPNVWDFVDTDPNGNGGPRAGMLATWPLVAVAVGSGQPKSHRTEGSPEGNAFVLSGTVGDISSGVIPVGVEVTNCLGAVVNVTVVCVPSAELLAEWRVSVVEALTIAYQNLLKRYLDELADAAFNGGDISGTGNPVRNRQRVQEELKRQFLMSIGVRFSEPGIVPPPPLPVTRGTWPRVIREPSPGQDLVLFMEQAFEWENLTFMLYPYFWANMVDWGTLATLDGPDPDLAQFLRAGAARVVVPARPGFEELVQFYLKYGVIWGGGRPPTPDEEGYMSVAEEIEAQQRSSGDGRVVDTWTVLLPTTLLALDAAAALPFSNDTPTIGPRVPADQGTPDP